LGARTKPLNATNISTDKMETISVVAEFGEFNMM